MMQPRAAVWMWHWDTSKSAGGFGLVGVSWGWTLGKGRCDHNLLLLCTNTADALISSFSSSQQCFEHPHPSGPEVHDSVWTQVISGTAVWLVGLFASFQEPAASYAAQCCVPWWGCPAELHALCALGAGRGLGQWLVLSPQLPLDPTVAKRSSFLYKPSLIVLLSILGFITLDTN